MLADNLRNVRETIASALVKRVGKKETGDEVCLVAVTKNHPAEVVAEIVALGVENIGENRVQEAREKQEKLGHPGKWHLIGHLQTNKAKQAVELFDLIESVDSEHLLQHSVCYIRAGADPDAAVDRIDDHIKSSLCLLHELDL